MMPLDPSIFQRFAPKSVQDYDKEYVDAQTGQQNLQINALKLLQGKDALADTQRQRGEQDAIRNAMMGAGSDDERVRRLFGLGTQTAFSTADTLRKGMIERQKAESQSLENKANAQKSTAAAVSDTLKQYRGALDFIDTPQGAQRWLAAQYQDPALAQHMQALGPLDQAVQRIPQDPQGFQQWRGQAGLGMETYQKQLLDQADKKAQRDVTIRGQDMTDSRMRSEGAANRGVTMRGQNLTDARTREGTAAAMSKPFEVTGPDGNPTLVQQDKQGNITPVTGFQPKGMGQTKLTEDQGKATGWLSQATNAYDNMQNALKSTPSAAKPGINDAIAKVPGLGSAANALRGADRQKYLQASSSLSEALLRAATGAGVNKDEALQKVQELTPQFGEGDDVIKQKMDAIPVYLESLKVRAGPGAKQLPGIMERAKAGSSSASAAAKTVVRTGTHNGKKVVQYSDGSVDYAN